MGNSLYLGQYIETNSVLHRLDPRTKLISMMILMLSFILLDHLLTYFIAMIGIVSLLWISRIPLLRFVKGLQPLLIILLFTFLYHALMTKGTILWSGLFLQVTVEGLEHGARFVVHIILLVTLASLLTLTTKPLTLAHGLERLLSPLIKLNVPVEQFALMIVIAIRFIPTIVQELDRIFLSQRARGYDISSLKITKRIFAYVPILIPLLFTTVKRAEQLSFAIDARAFGKGKGRIVFHQLKLLPRDYIAGGIATLFLILLFFLKLSLA
ncbi:energy-coupling factor transport system permease protein [Paenibacillus shirakamiensis]|uniref:Energy-coupling factor transport system permease protein n=1 Tax=Paenibacillus shirakamiensis TaxID=1265935 RepID=A0ABS4JDW4_9BACL|nr:energy-coupling factor transporter transmembrane protein EcfT [Paenibacillus shirakamiensis]MBP1999910.1 energy-coupling factor transport system permease protein [Paenibacillus shirakamiensis]